jgi:DNA-binding MarR family transcriptional regulator
VTDSTNTFRDDRLTRRQQLQWELLTSLGICTQLSGERARQALGPDLPLPLFTILNHFKRLGGGKTVTDLAGAFQLPQPGVTKSVQKLIAAGHLRFERDPDDARRKLLHLTPAGARAHDRALARLAPDADFIFADWTTEEMEALQRPLFRLRRHLDENRENGPAPALRAKT